MEGRERKQFKTLIVLLAIVGAALVLCGGLAVFGLGSTLYVSLTQKDDVKVVLEQFMQHMTAKDTRAAHSLFSSRAQRFVSEAKIKELLRGNNGVAFIGYRWLEVDGMTVHRNVNTDPSVPQGLVATVHGRVTYSDGFVGSLQAVLEKEAGRWRLHDARVTVPLERLPASQRTPAASEAP
jgi:hypothetical protein